jgi:hypothetical protein
LSGRARPGVPHGQPLRPDWQSRLMAWLDEAGTQAEEYGRTDCALTAADAVLAQTDWDPAVGLRGRYKTAAGAARVIRRHGGLEALATAVLGPPLLSPLLAQTGDVALFAEPVTAGGETREIERLGVIVQEHVWARADAGLTYRTRSVVRVAWPVGRTP